MDAPTFSDDGQWMWTGNDWIPAPPQNQVLDSSSLDMVAIQSAAGNAGISQASLTNAAPQQYPGSNSHVAVHQQYAAPQTQNMNPIIYNPTVKKSNSDNTASTVVGVCMIALAIVLASVGTYAYTSSSDSSSVGDADLDIDEILDDINLDSDYDGIDDGYDSCPNGHLLIQPTWTEMGAKILLKMMMMMMMVKAIRLMIAREDILGGQVILIRILMGMDVKIP